MAACDYRSCDVCGCKVFYDANLNYDFDNRMPDGSPTLDYLGDWKVLCENCAVVYKCVVVVKEKFA